MSVCLGLIYLSQYKFSYLKKLIYDSQKKKKEKKRRRRRKENYHFLKEQMQIILLSVHLDHALYDWQPN
jgi:transposase